MPSRVELGDGIDISEQTVLATLDAEAKKSTGAATRLAVKAVRDESPVGETKRLRPAHRASVRRTGYGYAGSVRRLSDAWYGRIVERGRKKGRSKRAGSRGRRYPAAPADPFVDRAAVRVADEVEQQLEAGGARAADKIDRKLRGG